MTKSRKKLHLSSEIAYDTCNRKYELVLIHYVSGNVLQQVCLLRKISNWYLYRSRGKSKKEKSYLRFCELRIK